MVDGAGFSHFPPETETFLRGIAANNDKGWFEAHRGLYEAGYVEAGRAFVEAIGPRLEQISPQVRYEARTNGSMMRINRDVRFSKDKRPYKDHLDLWFWHGDRKGWDMPGFYLRITPDLAMLGSGMHALQGPMLDRFRDAVADAARGERLRAVIGAVSAAGYEVGGATRKTVPRGFDRDHPRATLLLHEGLYAGLELPAAEALEPGFADRAVAHFRATWPIGQWLLDEVAGA